MIKATTCKLVSITELTSAVKEVVLKPETPVKFCAGQYILVHMSEDDKRPFSIASPVYQEETLTLQIGVQPDNHYAAEVLNRIEADGQIELSGGYGEAYLRDTDKPSILVAGGTGFSYVYSILQQKLFEKSDADITLYWGVREPEDFYHLDKLQDLSDKHPHFRFIPVVEHPPKDWHGRVGWVHSAVLSDYESMKTYQVYIAGRFEMAKTARDDFFKQGLSEQALYGDAYAFL